MVCVCVCGVGTGKEEVVIGRDRGGNWERRVENWE